MTGYLENVTVKSFAAGKQVSVLGVQMTDGVFSPSLASHYSTWFNRINWSGTALSSFYAAIRKALVVVIVMRAISVLLGIAFAGWWVFGRSSFVEDFGEACEELLQKERRGEHF
jgi:hypothetical protein